MRSSSSATTCTTCRTQSIVATAEANTSCTRPSRPSTPYSHGTAARYGAEGLAQRLKKKQERAARRSVSTEAKLQAEEAKLQSQAKLQAPARNKLIRALAANPPKKKARQKAKAEAAPERVSRRRSRGGGAYESERWMCGHPGCVAAQVVHIGGDKCKNVECQRARAEFGVAAKPEPLEVD
jgi:hypothetical protein